MTLEELRALPIEEPPDEVKVKLEKVAQDYYAGRDLDDPWAEDESTPWRESRPGPDEDRRD